MSRRDTLKSNPRERLFFRSLCYHGFRFSKERKNLKMRYGYIMPATQREDSQGIDCYVKMPKDARILPVQVTQRGVRYYRYIHKPTTEKIQDFVARSERRISLKRQQCYKNGIVFVLLRDMFSFELNASLAKSDIRALYHGVRNLKRLPK